MSIRERELARMRAERAAHRRRVQRERQLRQLRVTMTAGAGVLGLLFAIAYFGRGHGCY